MSTITGSKRKRQEAELEDELLQCAVDGDHDRARELVELEQVNVNCVDSHGRTPLMYSAWNNRVDIARFLRENGANVDAADNNGWTALVHAVWCGRVGFAELLLDEFDANIEHQFHSGSYSYSLLGWAIYKEMVGMVALLLRHGANTQETHFQDRTYTAVYLACAYSNMEVVQLLLDHDDGVDINAFVPRGHGFHHMPAMSPLCRACRRNNMEMVQLLIQRGARVIYNGFYPDVPCPLKRSVEGGSLAIIRFLLDHSGFLEPANEENTQVPEIVGDNHPLSVALEFAIEGNKLEAAQLLVNRGANVNDKPFLWQCAKYEISTRFPRDCGIGIAHLRAGADGNLAELESGETPLWPAAKNGHVEIVRLLLRAGAHVNFADNETGQTPLWAAANNGHVQMVKVLMDEAGANVNIAARNGETPLAAAHRQGHTDVVYDLLIRTSKDVWPRLFGLIANSP